MQVFIAVMGFLVTLIVVAGMILIAPAGTEQAESREDLPADAGPAPAVVTAPAPVAGAAVVTTAGPLAGDAPV